MKFTVGSSDYWKAVKFAIAIQIPIEFFALILLDGGQFLLVNNSALGGFWAGALLILVRRPSRPDSKDLNFLRIGYLACLCLAMGLTPFIAWLKYGFLITRA
jgi:hypothetical protein